MLRRGDKGDEVGELQHRLGLLGYLTRIDKDFDAKTEANLMSFQFDNSLKVDGIYGPLTQAVISQKLRDSRKEIDPTPVSNSETPWMDWLVRNEGQSEISGSKANPFIVDLFRYTSLRNHPLSTSDETAWCAALACAALEKNGYKSPDSASAASFDSYGTECELKYGAILTFRRKGGSGRHVTFYYGEVINGKIKCLGGNQSNSLKKSTYSKSDLVSIRWPQKKA